MPWHALVAALALGASAMEGFFEALIVALVLAAVGALFWRGRDLAIFGLAVAASFALGLGLAQLALPAFPSPTPAELAGDGRVFVSARLEEVVAKPGGRLECRLGELSFAHAENGQQIPLPGRMLLSWDQASSPPPALGSRLGFHSKVRETDGFRNEHGFDLGLRRRFDSLFSRSFVRGPTAVLLIEPAKPGLFEQLGRATRQAILGAPDAAGRFEPGRAVLLAMVLGDTSAMDQSDLDRIRRASLMHLLALSGMNVAYVVSVAAALVWALGQLLPRIYERLPRSRLAIVACLPLLLLYVVLSGGGASFVRAVLMFAAVSLLLFRGRSLVVLDALGLAVAVMVLVSPVAALGLSLRLSVGAVLGLLLLYPLWQRYVPKPVGRSLGARALGLALSGLGVSLCAQLGVLPVLAESFGEFSPHLYLNILWVPLTGFAVAVGALGVLLEYVPGLSWCGQALVSLSSVTGQGLLHNLIFLDAKGWLSMWRVMRPDGLEVAGYVVLAASAAWAACLSARRLHALVLLGLGLLLAPHAVGVWLEAQPAVELAMLDVGQGQALLVRTPGGHKTLVDTGGLFGFDVGGLVAGLCSKNENPHIDRIIMTHGDFDHVGGSVSLIASGLVAEVFDNGLAPKAEFGTRLAKALAAQGLKPTRLGSGDRVDLGGQASLDVLWPPKNAPALPGNDGSLIMALSYQSRPVALLTGDATTSALDALAQEGRLPVCPVVSLPHHGSIKNHSPAMYDAVKPVLALASTGQGNSYGLPSPAVVDFLAARGINFFNTAVSGGLTIRFCKSAPNGLLRQSRPWSSAPVQAHVSGSDEQFVQSK